LKRFYKAPLLWRGRGRIKQFEKGEDLKEKIKANFEKIF